MKAFNAGSLGRTLVINLERGDLLLESIQAALDSQKIENAVILSAIGSLQQVHLHRVTGFEETPVDEFIMLKKPMELSSLQGLIVDGKPHIHMVVSDLESAYTGHLEDNTQVLYLVEIIIAEVKDIQIERRKNEKGIAEFYEKK